MIYLARGLLAMWRHKFSDTSILGEALKLLLMLRLKELV